MLSYQEESPSKCRECDLNVGEENLIQGLIELGGGGIDQCYFECVMSVGLTSSLDRLEPPPSDSLL